MTREDAYRLAEENDGYPVRLIIAKNIETWGFLNIEHPHPGDQVLLQHNASGKFMDGEFEVTQIITSLDSGERTVHLVPLE